MSYSKANGASLGWSCKVSKMLSWNSATVRPEPDISTNVLKYSNDSPVRSLRTLTRVVRRSLMTCLVTSIWPWKRPPCDPSSSRTGIQRWCRYDSRRTPDNFCWANWKTLTGVSECGPSHYVCRSNPPSCLNTGVPLTTTSVSGPREVHISEESQRMIWTCILTHPCRRSRNTKSLRMVERHGLN